METTRSRVHLTYGAAGLLTELTDTLDRVDRFAYSGLGRLTYDEDPVGGSKDLVPAGETNGHAVTITTALGQATTYHTQSLPSGAPARAIDLPSGLGGSAVGGAGGPVTITRPDGSTVTWAPGPDPRFGMLASFAKTEVRATPGGKTQTTARSRAATLLNPADAMSFTTITDTTTIPWWRRRGLCAGSAG